MPNVYQIPGGGAWQDGASGLELQLPGLGVVQESAGGATPTLPTLTNPTLVWVSGNTYQPRVTATYSWTPAALFASSEEGGWYEPGPTTCYTDDGTTAAGENDLVYRMDDLSGNGNHLYQTDEAKRPILRKSGELWYLEFDGVDDLLIMPIGTLTLGAGWTLAAAGAVTETGTGGSLGSTSPGFGMAVDGLNYQRISLETDSTPRAATHSRGSGASPDAVAFAEDAFGGFSRNTNITVAARFSASDIEAALSSTTLSGVTPADTWGANTSSGARISFANRGNGTGIGKTIWFGAVAVNEELSNESAASLIEYLATLGGVTLA